MPFNLANLFGFGMRPKLPIPVALTAPTISGPLTVGATITFIPGTYTNNPDSITHVLMDENDNIISGSTFGTFVLPSELLGLSIYVSEIAHKGQHKSAENTSGEYGPVITVTTPANITRPTITGNLTAGNTITIVPGTWSNNPTSLTHQLYAGGAPIPGAVGLSFDLTNAQAGLTLNVSEAAVKPGTTPTPVFSVPYGPVAGTSVVATVGAPLAFDNDGTMVSGASDIGDIDIPIIEFLGCPVGKMNAVTSITILGGAGASQWEIVNNGSPNVSLRNLVKLTVPSVLNMRLTNTYGNTDVVWKLPLAVRTFFVDHSVSTQGTGSKASPWKYVPRDKLFTGSYTPAPGDLYIFKSGVPYMGELTQAGKTPSHNGNATNPIVLSGIGWGSGKALFEGADTITGWLPCDGTEPDLMGNPNWANIKKIAMPFPVKAPHVQQLFVDGASEYVQQTPQNPNAADFDNLLVNNLAMHNTATANATWASGVGTITDPWISANIPVGVDPVGAYVQHWTTSNMIKYGVITAFDRALNKLTIAMPAPFYYISGVTKWAFQNIPGMISVPGQFATSVDGLNLYYYPRAAFSLTQFSRRQWLIPLKYRAYTWVQGFTVEHYFSNIVRPVDARAPSTVTSPADAAGTAAAQIGSYMDTPLPGIRITNNNVRFVRSEGGQGVIGTTGAGGILDGAIERNTVDKCPDSSGIRLASTGSRRVRIAFNDVTGTGRTAIYFSGDSILCEYNYVHDIYNVHGNGISCYGNTATHNCTVRFNEVIDVLRAVTFDGNTTGVVSTMNKNNKVYQNIFVSANSPTIGNNPCYTGGDNATLSETINNIFATLPVNSYHAYKGFNVANSKCETYEGNVMFGIGSNIINAGKTVAGNLIGGSFGFNASSFPGNIAPAVLSAGWTGVITPEYRKVLGERQMGISFIYQSTAVPAFASAGSGVSVPRSATTKIAFPGAFSGDAVGSYTMSVLSGTPTGTFRVRKDRVTWDDIPVNTVIALPAAISLGDLMAQFTYDAPATTESFILRLTATNSVGTAVYDMAVDVV